MITEEIKNKLSNARKNKKLVVLVTGVFDLLHSEHVLFLKKAKALGDVLVVGLESDFRVKQIKGPSRPINGQEIRKNKINDLEWVDHVFILPEEFSKPEQHKALISEIKPDFLAVSSHTKHLDAKMRILNQFGGAVKIVHEFNPEVSTSKILEGKVV